MAKCRSVNGDVIMKVKLTKVGNRLGQRQPLSLLDYMLLNLLRLFYSPTFSLLFLMLLWLGYIDYLGTASVTNTTNQQQSLTSDDSRR